MKPITSARWIGYALGTVAIAVLLFLRPTISVSSSFSFDQLFQGSLPQHGWSVCADLGIGPVPGQPGNIQRVRLCHGSGWEVNAFCLEPAKPVPPVGTLCSMVNATDFWCGDANQEVRQYQIQQTPPPVPSSTPTLTLTTPPNQPTSTPLTPAPQQSSTPAPQATVFSRPSPGGPGNLGLLLASAATVAGLAAFSAAFLRLRRPLDKKDA